MADKVNPRFEGMLNPRFAEMFFSLAYRSKPLPTADGAWWQRYRYSPDEAPDTVRVVPPPAPRCECGVTATGVGGVHSDWCPLAGRAE